MLRISLYVITIHKVTSFFFNHKVYVTYLVAVKTSVIRMSDVTEVDQQAIILLICTHF